MNHKRQNWRWWVDVTLFVGFVLAALLDLTGLPVHQWLGLGVGLLAGYHLLAHWGWVRSVSGRLANGASQAARRYYLVDAGLLLGFGVILVTGLGISTWLNLSLESYAAWREVHVAATLGTLALVVIKIGLHGRWVVNVGRRVVHSPAQPATPARAAPVALATPAPASPRRPQIDTGRRDFLRLMGIVSLAAFVAASSALDDDSAQAQAGEPVSVETEENTSQAANSRSSSAVASGSTGCVVQCNRRCSYPGHCRRYRDSNHNGRCDFGECA